MRLRSVIQLLRVEQWTKNLFVFLPLFFGGKLMEGDLLLQCSAAFLAFSLAASSVYCFNDVIDVDTDRSHHKKCRRPLASGALSISTAYLLMAGCLTGSVLVSSFLVDEGKIQLLALLGFYYLMNIAYSIKLKSFAIVDVMIIALGFVLRILVGGAVTGTRLSEWIVIMTFLLALLLAFAKRRDDVVLFESTGIAPRKNTDRYNIGFLNQIMSVLASVTMIAYIMYTLSPQVKERFGSDHIYITALFVLAGIIRYLQVTLVDLKSGDPTEVLLKDRFIQLCITGWMATFLFIIYL